MDGKPITSATNPQTTTPPPPQKKERKKNVCKFHYHMVNYETLLCW